MKISTHPASSIQHQGYHALSLARHFGSLDRLDDPKEPDAVYFSVLRMLTVVYSSTWTVPLAIAVAGVFSSVVMFGLRRRILTWRGIGYGAFLLLVGLIVATLPSILLERWMPSVTSRFVTYSLDQSVIVSIAALSTLVLTSIWYYFSRRIRSTSVPDLTIGALMPLFVALIVTSTILPAISYLFAWPVLLSLLASVNWFYWHTRHKNVNISILGLLLSGATNIVILGPTILRGLFDQMLLTLVLLGVLCGLLVPQIHLMLGNNIGNQEPVR